MPKLKFNFQIKGLDGKDFQGEENSASDILANMISRCNEGKAIKLWDWATTIYKKKELELSVSEVEVLTALVEENKMLPIITKAQLLKAIEEQCNKK